MNSIGYNLLQKDKKVLFNNNIFSSACILSNGKEIQGKNSLLDKNDINYNSEDTLKCIGNFIGISLNDNGANNSNIAIMSDSAECNINIDDIKIGKLAKDWLLSFVPIGINKMIDFKIDNILEDRIIGTYRIKLSILKKSDSSNSILKNNRGI